MRLQLSPHLHSPCAAVTSIEVEIIRPDPATLRLRYRLTGTIPDLFIPPAATPARADGLWQHTCFEAFLQQSDTNAYLEFNFSPSTQWAAYSFDTYRSGMQPLDTSPPHIETSTTEMEFELTALVEMQGDGPWRLGLSAVIEMTNGRKSYWALAHPAAKPDFHHPQSFLCELS